MSTHKPIPKKIRIEVWEKYNHHCAYCGCHIEYKDMQVDHVENVYVNCEMKQEKTLDEINDIKNLMPSCRQCNFYKSTFDLEEFRERLTTTLIENLSKTFQYKLAIKYGLIKEYIKPVIFYFEKENLKKEV